MSLEAFKNREIKATELFNIVSISKIKAWEFIKKHHYLGEAKFFSCEQFGLYIETELVGCATFSNPQGISALKSWFGLENSNKDILELSRLCVVPSLNGSNATSFLLGRTLKALKAKDYRAVITLADDSRHVGSIYQICNFKYYGLTSKKSDFYTIDGKLNPRGETKEVKGVWLPRNQKHRYAYIMNTKLKCLLEERKRPDIAQTKKYECCGGTGVVLDKRFFQEYSCPKCSGKLELLKDSLL